ncbi:hypothetical protein [Streptomyces sp. NPDC026092]|uniref:hypothetical protein n=1 Tax=Streptomyces sp. NPDC026092 TaxID=3154797 RepID=UPI0033DEC4C3
MSREVRGSPFRLLRSPVVPVMLPVLALVALALLVFNTVQCVRVWRITELPLWRRVLPAVLLLCALVANVARVWDGGAVSRAFVLALSMSAPVLAMFELDRHRKLTAAQETEPSGSAV